MAQFSSTQYRGTAQGVRTERAAFSGFSDTTQTRLALSISTNTNNVFAGFGDRGPVAENSSVRWNISLESAAPF
jgi:hypothetical protein